MTTEKPTPAELQSNLRHFTGSTDLTRWSGLFRRHLLTEGTLYLAEAAACYWLMDSIASYQGEAWALREDFQVWELRKRGASWMLSATDGNGSTVAGQEIEYSDFPLDYVKLFAVRNHIGGVTIMLPSEY